MPAAPIARTARPVSASLLWTRRPAASIVYTLTLPRFAVATTFLNCGSTLSGIASPSAKKTTVLRPGRIPRALVTAMSAFVVAYPCWSRAIASQLLCVA